MRCKISSENFTNCRPVLIYSSMFRELFMTEWHTSRRIVTQFFAHDYLDFDWLNGNYDIVNSLHIFVYCSIFYVFFKPIFVLICTNCLINIDVIHFIPIFDLCIRILLVNKYLGHRIRPIKISFTSTIFVFPSHFAAKLRKK